MVGVHFIHRIATNIPALDRVIHSFNNRGLDKNGQRIGSSGAYFESTELRSSDHLQMAPTSRFRQRGSRQALIAKIAAIEDTAKITDSYILMMRLW